MSDFGYLHEHEPRSRSRRAALSAQLAVASALAAWAGPALPAGAGRLSQMLGMPSPRPVDASALPGSQRLMALAGVALAACSLTMIAASLAPVWVAVALLVLGMIFMSLGEIWQSAAAWTLSYTFAPAAHRVQHLTIFGASGLLAQDVLGPLLLAGFMIDVGRVGWLALAALFLASIPALRPVVSGLRQHQENPCAVPAGHALTSQS